MSETVSKKAKLENNPRSNDRIILNVGGTKIFASKVTLSSSSLYFSRQFSNEWNNNNREDDSEEFYLDQDPDDFKILLSFMRIGKIEVKKLTPFVLMLANFLGMERLLVAVRVTAKRLAFSGKKNLLNLAIKAGIMTTNEADVKAEYVSLLIFDPTKVSLRSGENSHAENLQGGVVAEIRGLKQVPPNKKITFIDGLNLLSRLGYNKFEEEECRHDRTMRPYVITKLQFSKLIEDEGADELANLILLDKLYYNHDGDKEFALLIEFKDIPGMNYLIEAAFGEKKILNIHFTNAEIDDERTTVRTRTSLLEFTESYETKMWLNNEGYKQWEYDLERLYEKALPREYKNLISSIRLWSRPTRPS